MNLVPLKILKTFTTDVPNVSNVVHFVIMIPALSFLLHEPFLKKLISSNFQPWPDVNLKLQSNITNTGLISSIKLYTCFWKLGGYVWHKIRCYCGLIFTCESYLNITLSMSFTDDGKTANIDFKYQFLIIVIEQYNKRRCGLVVWLWLVWWYICYFPVSMISQSALVKIYCVTP